MDTNATETKLSDALRAGQQKRVTAEVEEMVKEYLVKAAEGPDRVFVYRRNALADAAFLYRTKTDHGLVISQGVSADARPCFVIELTRNAK
jgi:hypothetical protein